MKTKLGTPRQPDATCYRDTNGDRTLAPHRFTQIVGRKAQFICTQCGETLTVGSETCRKHGGTE